MINKLISMRVSFLLLELEQISDRLADLTISASDEMSPLKKVMHKVIEPKDLKRILSIKNQLELLGYIFNKKENNVK